MKITETTVLIVWVLGVLIAGFCLFAAVRGLGEKECSLKEIKLQQVVSYDLPDNRRENGQDLVQSLQRFLRMKGLQEQKDQLLPVVVYRVSTVPSGERLTLRVSLLGHERSFSFDPSGPDYVRYSKVERFICSCFPDTLTK